MVGGTDSAAMSVAVGGQQAFVARVCKDGDERIWVCVRGEHTSATAGWAGAWSAPLPIAKSALSQFLEALSERIREVGALGSFGQYLDGHLFFEGWETWGVGIPAPLAGQSPRDSFKQRGERTPSRRSPFDSAIEVMWMPCQQRIVLRAIRASSGYSAKLYMCQGHRGGRWRSRDAE